MTHRFFIPKENISKSSLTITGDDARQIRLVLRLFPGDEVLAMDGAGIEYLAGIRTIEKGAVTCDIISRDAVKSEPEQRISLIQSIPKEAKMDQIIQRSTELGAFEFIPVTSERTIVKLVPEKAAARIIRWQKIAKEAAEQSGRGIIPEIKSVTGFDKALRAAKDHELKLIPWEMEGLTTLKEALQKKARARSVAVAIGPEGGFSSKEIELAKEEGFVPVSLGRRILRTETAGPAVIAMILYELDL